MPHFGIIQLTYSEELARVRPKKMGRIRDGPFEPGEALWAIDAEYIDRFYNRIRCHSHLSGVSLEAFEAVSTQAYQGVRKILGSPVFTSYAVDGMT
jgi:hypothetical protein